MLMMTPMACVCSTITTIQHALYTMYKACAVSLQYPALLCISNQMKTCPAIPLLEKACQMRTKCGKATEFEVK